MTLPHCLVALVLLYLAVGVSAQSVVSLLVVTTQSFGTLSVVLCNIQSYHSCLNLTNYFYSVQVLRFSLGVFGSCIVLGYEAESLGDRFFTCYMNTVPSSSGTLHAARRRHCIPLKRLAETTQ